MIDEVRRLLDYIVNNYVVRDEVRSIDRDASVVPDGQSIEEDKQDAARREEQHAGTLADAFNTGLMMSWRRFRMGGNELPLDDRDAAQNRIADSLIQLLVRFDLAKSRSEETEPRQYTYYITVDWPHLFELGSQAGVDLEAALNRSVAERAS